MRNFSYLAVLALSLLTGGIGGVNHGHAAAPPEHLSQVAQLNEPAPQPAAGSCMLTYTDCNTRQNKAVAIASGQTILYGDWDGSTCVRKEFTCRA